MTLKFPDELRQAIEGQPETPLQVIDETTHTAYVIMRADVYDRMKSSFADGEWNVREMYPHLAKVFGPAGWDDPAMDIYDELDPRRQP